MQEVPELIARAAQKAVAEFCADPVIRSGIDHWLSTEPAEDGIVLLTQKGVGAVPELLARLRYSDELGQWTLHRPLSGARWSYVPEAGGALDVNRLLRYLRDDPLLLFWR